MDSRPFFLTSEAYERALLDKLCVSLSTFPGTLASWKGLREQGCTYIPDSDDHRRVKAEILTVTAFLQQDYKLLRDLDSVLPLGFKLSCYPHQPESQLRVTEYFVLLSTAYDEQPWGEVYSTIHDVGNEKLAKPLLSLHALRVFMSSSAKRKDRFDRAKRDGWLPCILDLLTWDIHSGQMERVFVEKATQIQVEIIESVQHLPFTIFYDGPLRLHDELAASDAPAESCHKGRIDKHPIWAQRVPSKLDENGSRTFEEEALRLALTCQNLRHKGLCAWSSVCSVVQLRHGLKLELETTQEFLLITSRKNMVNFRACHDDQNYWKDSHRFKLATIISLLEAVQFLLYSRHRRELDDADIFFDKQTTRCYLAHSRLWVPPVAQDCSRDFDLEKALNDHYRAAVLRVVRSFYPPTKELQVTRPSELDRSPLPGYQFLVSQLDRELKKTDKYSTVKSLYSLFQWLHDQEEVRDLLQSEISVTTPEDPDSSGDESETTLVGSAVSTPSTLSPNDDERSLSSSGDKTRRRSGFPFSLGLSKDKKNDTLVSVTPDVGVPSKSAAQRLTKLFGRGKSRQKPPNKKSLDNGVLNTFDLVL